MAATSSTSTASSPSWFERESNAPSTDGPSSDRNMACEEYNDIQIQPLSAGWRRDSLAQDKRAKVYDISRACHDRSLESLRKLAASEGGLVEDEMRRTAWRSHSTSYCLQQTMPTVSNDVVWIQSVPLVVSESALIEALIPSRLSSPQTKALPGPLLLGCDPQHQDISANAWVDLPPHRDEHQVELDVHRSFVFYPRNESESRKDARKVELSNVITAVLRRHPLLHYFQGYHDIVQVLLLVLGAHEAVEPVARLSLLRVRDFMLPSMIGTESHLRLLPAILYAVDAEVCHHLSHTQPFFALAATLTLYAHDIEEYGDIARLFDFLLASEASVPLYLFAVIVVSRKKELLEIDADEPEMLHAVLSKLPKPLDLEHLIHRTIKVFHQHPPEKLPGRAWSRVSSNSVLKTTHDCDALQSQTLEEGERMFERHDSEIKRKKAWQKRLQQLRALSLRYQRPATLTALAVAFALVAYAARDEGRVRSLILTTVPLITRLRETARELLDRHIA